MTPGSGDLAKRGAAEPQGSAAAITIVSMEAVDVPTVLIAEFFARNPALVDEELARVQHEVDQRLQLLVPPPGGLHLETQAAAKVAAYLRRCHDEATGMLRAELRGMFMPNQYRWLWYLRRLPVSVFEGELATTLGYDSLLAEVLSGWAPDNTNAGAEITQGMVHYPTDPQSLRRLARLAAWTKVISRFHQDLRWASKGTSFRFAPDSSLPEPVPTIDERTSVRLFDDRMATQDFGFFPHMGTDLGLRIPEIVRHLETASAESVAGVVPIKPTVVPIPQHGIPLENQLRTMASFMPVVVPLHPLIELLERLPVDGLPQHLGFLLQLLDAVPLIWFRRQDWLANTMQRGYIAARRTAVVELLDEILQDSDLSSLKRLGGRVELAATGDELLQRIAEVPGSELPLLAGPLIRQTDQIVAIDLWGITARTNRDVYIRAPGGAGANIRSRHFEDAVQDAIDRSSWRPRPQIAALRQRTLRVGGQALTDVDAIAQRGSRLLVVACKGITYTPEYDAGDYAAVRNAASTIDQALDQLERLKRLPVGDNYDFRGFDILGVACTPSPFYVRLGLATAQVLPGLRGSCSLAEFQIWLMQQAAVVDRRRRSQQRRARARERRRRRR